MNSTVRRSSREAYNELVRNGKESGQRARILHYLLHRTIPVTRLQLSKDIGIPVNAISGRVNAMIKDGLITEADQFIKCPVSGKTVAGLLATYPVPEMPEQMKLT